MLDPCLLRLVHDELLQVLLLGIGELGEVDVASGTGECVHGRGLTVGVMWTGQEDYIKDG